MGSTPSSASSLSSLNRMSGTSLASGLDTEALVKSMAANTKNRLNRKKQKFQTLQWKQEAYRTHISALSSFQSKYLSLSSGSSTSIKANTNMSKFSATSSNSKVTATASSSATAATYTIKEATAASKASITSTSNVINNTVKVDLSSAAANTDYKLSFTVDGTTKDINFNSGADSAAAQQNFLDALNEQFGTAGSFAYEDGTQNLKFTQTNTNDGIHHTFNVKYNADLGIMNTTYSDINGAATLGSINFTSGLEYTGYKYTTVAQITGQDSNGNNVVEEFYTSKGYYAMDINGTTFEFDDDTSITTLMNKVNDANIGVKMTFSTFNQSFRLETTETGAGKSININNVTSGPGIDEGGPDHIGGNLASALFGSSNINQAAYGTDSTITVSSDGQNFVTLTSASNSYTFDGTTINVTNLGTLTAEQEPITVTTERDYSGIKDLIVNFVNDYNKLVEQLYNEMNTARPKSKGSYYDPLTEEQEEEMESDDIDKWNIEAKKGLLYHDSNISKVLTEMNTTITSAFNGFSLSDLGISTPKFTDADGKVTINNGYKLIIDETKLDSCLQNYGETVAKFFTDTTNGLATKLDKTINNAISTSKTNRGYLTSIAGIENTSTDKVNSLFNEMKSLQEVIDSMQTRYENEMNRYWKRFTALESYISNMNSQASIFSSE